ncbi:hypothetical protein PSP6_690086 [Paraburkholderia tropica]|nr:hypothetical protein PSP6_690086 [Paraburkholderia tropica]
MSYGSELWDPYFSADRRASARASLVAASERQPYHQLRAHRRRRRPEVSLHKSCRIQRQ